MEEILLPVAVRGKELKILWATVIEEKMTDQGILFPVGWKGRSMNALTLESMGLSDKGSMTDQDIILPVGYNGQSMKTLT